MHVMAQFVENRIIGIGRSSSLVTKLEEEQVRAANVQMPIAVEANSVGKKYWLEAKLMLNEHVTPNLAGKNNTKKRLESWWSRPQKRIKKPPIVEIANESIKLNLTPTFMKKSPETT